MTKKYVSLDKLSLYDEKIKKHLADADAVALQSAMDYADGLAVNYDEAGAAATAEQNAKAYADGKDAAIAEAKKAGTDAAAAAGVAQAAAEAAQGEVDALETYVGTFTHDTAKTVVEYINEKTAGIATDAALGELQATVTQLGKDVDAIEADYLKNADKEELAGDIADAMTAVDTEKGRAEEAEAGLAARIKAVEDDHLVAADKTELADAIADEAERAAGVEEGLAARIKAVEDDYLVAADKEALQTQINTIMNNPDAEGAINSINEFTQYVKDHGTIAEGFRTDIDKNKEDIAAAAKAIADHETLAGQTYATKTELANEKKALQDEIDADVKVVADDLTELAGVVEGLGNTKADKTALEEAVEALEGADADIIERVAAVEAQLGDGEGSVADLIADAMQEAIDAAAAAADTKDEVVLAAAKQYADDEDAKLETLVANTKTELQGELATAIEGAKTDASNKDAVVLAEAQKGIAAAQTAVQTALDTHANNAVVHITAAERTAWNAIEANANAYTDAAMAKFVEVSEEEINALFPQPK